MLAESQTHTTRAHHSRHPHSASKHRARGKHSHRSVVPYEGALHTPQGHTRTDATHNRRVDPVDSLTATLTHKVSTAKLESKEERKELVNTLVQDINQQQKELRQYYSSHSVMVAILEGRLRKWRKRTVRSLTKTLPSDAVQHLRTSLRKGFKNTIASIEANPSHTATPITHNTQNKPHTPQKRKSPKFYLETQEAAQCGRHAINAFYQKDILPYRNRFNNMYTDAMYKQMQEIEKLKGKNRQLLFLEHNLIGSETDKNDDEIYYSCPTPEFFDDMPIKRMVLSMAGHHVCFFRYNNEWHLLDSLRNRSVKMLPSAYIEAHRQHYSQQQLEEMTKQHRERKTCKRCKKNREKPNGKSCKKHTQHNGFTNSLIHVICWEKGQKYEGDRCFGRNNLSPLKPQKGEYLDAQKLKTLQK